jgi:hypothetical protein
MLIEYVRPSLRRYERGILEQLGYIFISLTLSSDGYIQQRGRQWDGRLPAGSYPDRTCNPPKLTLWTPSLGENRSSILYLRPSNDEIRISWRFKSSVTYASIAFFLDSKKTLHVHLMILPLRHYLNTVGRLLGRMVEDTPHVVSDPLIYWACGYIAEHNDRYAHLFQERGIIYESRK